MKPSRIEWLPNWLGVSYSRLFGAFGDELFTFEEARGTLDGYPKLVLSLLRRKGWLTVFGRDGKKRSYRLLKPHLATHCLALGADAITKQGRYANLAASAATTLASRFENRLQSLVVFGSVGRGTATPSSDMDVIVVAEFRRDAPSRIDELVEIEYSGDIAAELAWLRDHGVWCHVSWFPLTAAQAARFRPLYLDLTHDALIVYDKDGLFGSVLGRLRSRLREQGAKRVWLDRERWYWELNPHMAELVAPV